MMGTYKNILGKHIELNSREAFAVVEQAICEGLLIPGHSLKENKNVFGRHINLSESTDLSFVSGLAASGLRTAAVLQGRDILRNSRQLEQAVRQQIPLVVMAEYFTLQQIYPLSDSGGLIWIVSSVQEAIDYTLIAHRIAELALIPVVIGIDQQLTHAVQKVNIPDSTALMGFLGNPDNRITSPTPSQEMLFGKSRRKIPNWFNPDIPVLVGAEKGLKDQTFEVAAREQFFSTHLTPLLDKVFNQFEKIFGRNYRKFDALGIKKADYVLITTGLLKENVLQALQFKYKKRIGLLHLNQMVPFPSQEVSEILTKKKAITVFDQCINHASSTPLFKEIASLQLNTVLYSAKYGELPAVEFIADIIRNMLPGGPGKTHFWVDVPFSKAHSAFPKHQILNQTIQREYPQSEQASITKDPIDQEEKPQNRKAGIPYVAKQFSDKGPVYSRVSRFYENTAALYEDPSELLADPFKATSILPPATAGLAPHKSMRDQLPVFHPEHCTACGDCFVYCPHAAIPPLALDLESIIQSGIKSATAKGIAITQLMPMVKNLAKFGHKEIRQTTDKLRKVSDFLPQAFGHLSRQMKLEGEQLQSAQGDFRVVMEEIGELKIAITEDLFTQRDTIDKDSGELFTIAIDPNACTGCGLCAAVCDFGALQMENQTQELERSIQQDFDIWEHLPDTSSHTITRLIEDEGYDSIAALLLSRNFYYSMTGGSSSEKHAPQKNLFHLLISSAEAAMQSHYNANIQSIDELLNKLSSSIQSQLSSALPQEDFHSLLETLQESREERVPFEAIIEKWSAKEHLSLVDKKALERKTELVQGLKDLKWAFTAGPTGNGRSRMGIVLDASLAEMTEFPWNNFTNPVMLNWQGSPEMARGLVKGHIRHFLDNIKLLRRAELEVKDKYVPKLHDREIAGLSWAQLTGKERSVLPPLLLITKRSTLTKEGLVELINMLNEDWPLKIMLLDDAIPSYENPESHLIANSSLLYPLIAQQSAFVVRTSLGSPDHFYKGIQSALHSSKPSLCWIYTPDKEKHSIPPNRWPHLHGLALSTRAFTHFIFDPSIEGTTVSSKIRMDSISPDDLWNTTQITYKQYGDEKSMDYLMTWADWAYTLNKWKGHFQLSEEENANHIFLPEYIKQEVSSREGVPVICRIGKDGDLKYYQVSDKVVRCTEASLSAWNLLLEFSGLKTEFPDKLKRIMEKELSRKYEEDINTLKTEYEGKINALEQEHLQKIKTQLKEKLLQLSQRRS